MGSLLKMILAEHYLFKLTKSICTCQGKKLLSLNQFTRKFHLKISRGVYLGHSSLTIYLLAGTDVAYPRKNSEKSTLRRKLFARKVSFYAAGRAKT